MINQVINQQRFHLADRASELDGATITEVVIGLEDGPSGRFRTLQRLRTTVRDAVSKAGETARLIAGQSQAQLFDKAARPAAIRVADGPHGSTILLDYDVQGEGGRTSRPLRLIMRARCPAIPAAVPAITV